MYSSHEKQVSDCLLQTLSLRFRHLLLQLCLFLSAHTSTGSSNIASDTAVLRSLLIAKENHRHGQVVSVSP